MNEGSPIPERQKDVEETIRKVFYRAPASNAPWAQWIKRKQRDEAWAEAENRKWLRKARKRRKSA